MGCSANLLFGKISGTGAALVKKIDKKCMAKKELDPLYSLVNQDGNRKSCHFNFTHLFEYKAASEANSGWSGCVTRWSSTFPGNCLKQRLAKSNKGTWPTLPMDLGITTHENPISLGHQNLKVFVITVT